MGLYHVLEACSLLLTHTLPCFSHPSLLGTVGAWIIELCCWLSHVMQQWCLQLLIHSLWDDLLFDKGQHFILLLLFWVESASSHWVTVYVTSRATLRQARSLSLALLNCFFKYFLLLYILHTVVERDILYVFTLSFRDRLSRFHLKSAVLNGL